MLRYKNLALAFSYPSDAPLTLEYDRLFRNSGIWLYTAEYTADNEFIRAQKLADINGFYRAFGLTPDKDRPDALPCALEFMHYLIFKEVNAPDKEKASICCSAQRSFLTEHLYPGAKNIAKRIIAQTKNDFYREMAEQMLRFLEAERKLQ